MENSDTGNNQFKVVLAGPSGCGKSSLFYRFNLGVWNPDTISTVGCDFTTKVINVENKKVSIQLWDTPGQYKYSSAAKTFYKGAIGCLLVFDQSDSNSLAETKKYMDMVKESTDNNCVFLLVGNKCDKDTPKNLIKISQLVQNLDLDYIKISSKIETNISQCFELIAKKILKFYPIVNRGGAQKLKVEYKNCPKHDILEDIICLECGVWSCYKCNLTSEHKKHDQVAGEEFYAEIKAKLKQLDDDFGEEFSQQQDEKALGLKHLQAKYERTFEEIGQLLSDIKMGELEKIKNEIKQQKKEVFDLKSIGIDIDDIKGQMGLYNMGRDELKAVAGQNKEKEAVKSQEELKRKELVDRMGKVEQLKKDLQVVLENYLEK